MAVYGHTASSQKDPANKQLTTQKGSICPVCLEIIVEATAKRSDDAIECSGFCKAWLHRCCAGLSKEAFQHASLDDTPFCCPHCRVRTLENKVLSLKSDINVLTMKASEIDKKNDKVE